MASPPASLEPNADIDHEIARQALRLRLTGITMLGLLSVLTSVSVICAYPIAKAAAFNLALVFAVISAGCGLRTVRVAKLVKERGLQADEAVVALQRSALLVLLEIPGPFLAAGSVFTSTSGGDYPGLGHMVAALGFLVVMVGAPVWGLFRAGALWWIATGFGREPLRSVI